MIVKILRKVMFLFLFFLPIFANSLEYEDIEKIKFIDWTVLRSEEPFLDLTKIEITTSKRIRKINGFYEDYVVMLICDGDFSKMTITSLDNRFANRKIRMRVDKNEIMNIEFEIGCLFGLSIMLKPNDVIKHNIVEQFKRGKWLFIEMNLFNKTTKRAYEKTLKFSLKGFTKAFNSANKCCSVFNNQLKSTENKK